MTEIARDLLKEQKEQKNIANQARHRKGSRGRKGCALPSDTLTKKERESQNGQLYSYQTERPMTWDEFTALPKHLQEMYIHDLQSKYHASIYRIGLVFGMSNNFGRWLNSRGIPYKNGSAGSRMTPKEKAAWQEFLNKGRTTEELDSTEAQSDISVAPIAEEKAIVPEPTPVPVPCKMKSFSMHSSGLISPDGIANTIRYLFGEGAIGDISIEITLKEDA